MLLMFYLILREDENIIQVCQVGDIKAIFQNIVDILLEHCGSIDKSEQYDIVLEVTVLDLEDCLPLITLLDPDQVVCRIDIKLHVHLDIYQPVEYFVDQGQKVSILPSQLVETVVIDAKLQNPILLFHKEDWDL